MDSISLSGRLVQLRDFRLDDTAAVHAIVGDDRVTRSLSFDSRDAAGAAAMVTAAVANAARDPRPELYLAVTTPAAGLIGFARLGLAGVRAAKLGYAIHADHWGHGYATDAAITILEFGFRTLELHRVSAAIGPQNGASLALAERLGMTYEGRIRDHVFTNGAWRDSLLFSVLDRDWHKAGQGHLET